MVWDHQSFVPANRYSLGPGFQDEQSGEPDTSGGFWNWWQRNGDSATDILNSGLCAINPRRAGCPGSRNYYPNGGSPQDSDNQTLLYLVVGLVILMLFILILRK